VIEPLAYPEFTRPLLRVASVVLDQSGGANDEAEIDPTDFSDANLDCVVDKLILFETSTRDPAADPGADTQLLADITGRYWFIKNQNFELPEVPIPALDSGPLDRTLPIVHGMQEPEDFSIVGWDLRRSPIVVPRNGVLRCNWENPTIVAAAPVPAGTVYVAASCRRRSDRRPVTLYLPVAMTASAGGSVAGPTGTEFDQTSSRNRTGEEMDLTELRMFVDGDFGGGGNFADTRLMRHMLLRPYIEPGDVSVLGCGTYAPMVAFGASRQLDHSVVTIDWSDEPIRLPVDDGIGFKFTNNSATNTRMFVVQVCRRLP